MANEIESIVTRNISGVCDSFVLNTVCVALQDNGYIEAAGQNLSCVRAIHRASERICPEVIKKDLRFQEYLAERIMVSSVRPQRQWLIEQLENLDSCVDRGNVFKHAITPQTSLLTLLWGIPVIFANVALGIKVSYFHKFTAHGKLDKLLEEHVNSEKIDRRVIFEELLAGNGGVPARYRQRVEEAWKRY
ncbi:hypothetical protein [Burkholderia sp. Ac-20344]|uniref:hypothetical protein n=1 Tax=Burkholderia sp. Ac-20344 TaxID=2703890 RepID=UPI00197CA34E|nr:hypothetical protein [Burkholderia sp. Ac-20344]MBN3832305.1 hypothetical protein [Burkholderia sp. Ac-20344]